MREQVRQIASRRLRDDAGIGRLFQVIQDPLRIGIAQGLDHFQRKLPPIHGSHRKRLVAVVGQLLQATPHDVAHARRNVDLHITERLRIFQQSFRDQQPDRLAHEEGVAFRLVPDPLDEDFPRTDPGG